VVKDEAQTRRRLRYGSEPANFGDLVLPGGPEPHPVVVLIHGGFWRTPYVLTLMTSLAHDLAARGYAAWNNDTVEDGVVKGQKPPVTVAEQVALVAAARAARRRAYAPYSRFRVGAAILTSRGEIVSGCNVENISYGLTNCAERTAVFAARAAGKLGAGGRGATIVAVAVVAQGASPPSPCGACRQVLNEFGPDCLVICANLRGDQRVATLAALLPDAFGPW